MNLQQLHDWAEAEVNRTLDTLPPEIQAAARSCAIQIRPAPTPIQAAEAGTDLLGLFEGCSRLEPVPDRPEQLPRISLFLENLWDEAEENEEWYREEVRITLLHELGHYLGWDEEQVERLGLG